MGQRTEKAAAKGLKDDWELIEAIAADAVEAGNPITSAASITDARESCFKVGRELETSTVKDYCLVAKYDNEATTKQRQVFRRYGMTIVRDCARKGVTQEAAAHFLAGSRKTRTDVRDEFSSVGPGLSRKTSDPEDWDDDEWDAFDASVIDATRTVLTAFNLRQRGQYEPSVEATAQLVLLRDSDWDRGLAELEA